MPRDPLISRVPDIWRRLDTDGVLAGFLATIDSEYDRIDNKILELFDLRNVDRIPDRYLHLLAPLVGHEWRTDKTRLWNRRRMRDAIRRWSYKGTYAALDDLVAEHGGQDGYSVQDNASKLLVLGKQGRLGYDDAYLVAPDYWHDGAFVLTLTESVNLTEFKADFYRYVAAAGERWWFAVSGQQFAVFETAAQDSTFASQAQFTPGGALGFGLLGISLFLSTEPNGVEATSTSPIYWDLEGNLFDGALGFGKLGMTLFLSTEPSGSAEEEVYTVEEGVGGASLTLDSITPLDSTLFDLSTSEDNPLAPEAAPDQPDGEIT